MDTPKLILLVYMAAGVATAVTTVETPSGRIRGLLIKDSITGENLSKFLGIKYGKAPIGDLRFRKPKAAGNWTGIYNATKFGPGCVQNKGLPFMMPPETSEDCLYLNIYVPREVKKGMNLSVMVWIHEGGLTMGHSNRYDGRRIALTGNVIVVTINYRLEILGFFAHEDPTAEARGNYGLWDQKLALQWVHNNIASFGGNPESVTIFGESAGGLSVNAQTLIPSNKGLFQRAIAQSGAFNLGRTMMRTKYEISETGLGIAHETKCHRYSWNSIVDCLKDKPAEEMLTASETVAKRNSLKNKKFSLESSSAPVLDCELFRDDPFLLLQNASSDVSKFFKSVEYMSGSVAFEGSLFLRLAPVLAKLYNFNHFEGVPSSVLCEAVLDPYTKTFLDGTVSSMKRLCKFYTVNGTLADQGRKAMEAFGDMMLEYPVIRMLDIHTALGGVTYQYHLAKQGSREFKFGPIPQWVKAGAFHGDTVGYLFPTDAAYNSFSNDEKELSDNVIKYWTSFAKTG